MSFLPEYENSDPSIKSRHLEWADKLHQTVHAHGKLLRRYSKSKWSSDFARLNQSISTDQISRILHWYIQHFGEQFVPEALSASGFCKKFQQITEARSRFQSKKNDWKKYQSISISYPEIVERVQQRTGDLIWPNNEKQDEPKFIQACLTNYDQWLSDLYDWKEAERKLSAKLHRDRCRETGRLDISSSADWEWFHLAEYLCNVVIYDAVEYVTHHWLPVIFRIARRWHGWDGNLLRWVWHPDHRMYVKLLKNEIMAEYCGDPEHWDACRKRMRKILKRKSVQTSISSR